MKRLWFTMLFIMLVCGTTLAQQRAFGLRVGDPLGVTFKQYTRTHKAIEYIVGTAARNWHHNYYENSFYKYDKYDDFTYRSHKVENSIYLQARYLLHYDIQVENMEGRLQWYWGLGGVLKFSRIEYRYVETPPQSTPRSDRRNNIDLGPDVIGGVEYTFEDIPLNVFGELSLMIELADRPFAAQLYGGVGARFIF